MASNAKGTTAAGISGALHIGRPAALQRASRCCHHPNNCGTLLEKRRLIQRGQSNAGKCASFSAKGARQIGMSRNAVRCRNWRWSTQKLGASPRISPVVNCEHNTHILPPSRRRISCKRCSAHNMTALRDLSDVKATSVRTIRPPICANCSAKLCSSSGRATSASAGSKPLKQTQASANAGANIPQNARDGRARSKHKWKYKFLVGVRPNKYSCAGT
mmetsp:Transcript_49611/g.124941  ORF Transcript_49611/g.124941 Transcript_49611/m.124941 type:complete len:217 (-) Transcript_49611:4909-5559(-)